MKDIFYYIGIVTAVIGGALVIVFGIALLGQLIEEKRRNYKIKKKKDKELERLRNLSLVLAVKIPCKDQYFTPVAYLYSRGDKTPVVTIMNPTFFKKLPDDTPVFTVQKDTKWDKPEITSVAHINYYHKRYHSEINRGWKIDPNE